MLLTWLPTVFGLMAQSRATCFVLRPLAIRVRMSRSRSLNLDLGARLRASSIAAQTVEQRISRIVRGQTPDAPWGGWGLPIVAALSSDWGVETTSGGKTVWAEL